MSSPKVHGGKQQLIPQSPQPDPLIVIKEQSESTNQLKESKIKLEEPTFESPVVRDREPQVDHDML